MPRVMRVGIIGAGMVAAHHLAAWSTGPNAKVVAIADPDLSRARDRAGTFAVPAAYADARTMLDREELDAIDIVAPVGTHADLCLLGAERGLAIMCQKPLCETAAQAASLMEAVGNRVRFKVHENWRFRPEYRRINELIREGRLGTIQHVSLDCSSSGLVRRLDGSYPALLRQPFFATLSRLIVFELLIHHLDLLTWLLGPLVIGKAELWRQCQAVRGEDTATIELLTAGGSSVRLTGSFCRDNKPEVPMDELVITGERAGLRFSQGQLELSVGCPKPEAFPFERSYPASYAGAIRDFLDGLVHHRPFETEAYEHLEILRLIEQIYANAQLAEA